VSQIPSSSFFPPRRGRFFLPDTAPSVKTSPPPRLFQRDCGWPFRAQGRPPPFSPLFSSCWKRATLPFPGKRRPPPRTVSDAPFPSVPFFFFYLVIFSPLSRAARELLPPHHLRFFFTPSRSPPQAPPFPASDSSLPLLERCMLSFGAFLSWFFASSRVPPEVFFPAETRK